MRASRILRAYLAFRLAKASLWLADRHLAADRREVDRLDLLFGIRAMARFMGLSRNQARALVARGAIPAFSLDGVTCARRSSIVRHIAALEARTFHAENLVNARAVKEGAHGERS